MIKLNNFALSYHISLKLPFFLNILYSSHTLRYYGKNISASEKNRVTQLIHGRRILFLLCALYVNTQIQQFNYRFLQVFFLDFAYMQNYMNDGRHERGLFASRR